jgi:cobalt-zinc-cadmium resistance protein CzcA
VNKLLNAAIALFYQKGWLSWLLLLAIIAGGFYAKNTLETEAYPEFTPPTVRIITLAPGKGSEEVERLITIPLEKEMNAIPKEVWMRSISILGLSVISVVFQDDSSQLQNRQQVLERISQADIPDYAQPSLDPDSGGVGEIYRYTVESRFYSPMSRKAIEDWQLERAFKQIPGVIDVVSFGGPTKNYQVNVDARKLIDYGITMDQIFQAISNSNNTTGGNYIENNGRAFVVRGLGLLTGIDDINRVVVSTTQNGVPVRIKDVATVDIGPGVRLGQFGHNQDDDAIMGIVLMRRGENPSTVVNRLYQKLPEIRALLPEGVQLVKLYDRQELVDHTLHTVSHNVLEGIFLVVVVLIIFLFDFTSGLIASVAIPLSLCLALFLLSVFHIPANLLSLGAIDFGIIVDGAVVMVENAFARLGELSKDASVEMKREVILRCAQQVGSPILFSTTIIIVSFLPIFTFDGVAGKLFRPLVFTMNFNLFGAIISALFIIPTLIGVFLLRRKISHRESPVIRVAHFIYRPVLGWCLDHTKIVLLGAVATLALTVFLGGQVGSEFLPPLDEGNIWLRATIYPPSVSLEQAVKIAKRIRELLSVFPEIKTITTQTGSPDDGTDPNLFSNVETFLDLKPQDEWRPEFHQNKAELIKALNKEVSVIPNVVYYFSQYIQDNVDESVAGAKGALAVKIFGPDILVLQQLGDQIADIATKVPGLVDVADNQQLGQPQYQIAIDRDQASRYGVNVSDVQSLVETAIGGKVATKLLEGEKRFPVRVRFSQEYRNTEKALDNILIDPPGPVGPVPLSQMASIKPAFGASFITRERNSRVMYVRMNVRGRDLGSAVRAVQKEMAAKVKIPEGYTVQWAGQYEFQQQANQHLMVIVPFTMAVIYLILLAAFASHRNAALIMCGVPLAALGGITALLLTGTYFSISAGVGFIALSGVAVQNGVILISHINHLRVEDELPVKEAAFRGAIDRMRPVLMTATVAMLGLLPAATSNGVGAQSQKPFAIVIIGGLISATLLTLVILPTLYTMLQNRPKDNPPSSQPQPVLSHMHSFLPFLFALLLCPLLSACSTENASKATTTTVKQIDKNAANEAPTPYLASKPGDGQAVQVNIDSTQEKEIGLQLTQVRHGFIDKSVEAPGRVQPNANNQRQIATPSAGRAVEVKVNLGDTVHAGQIVAVIKSDSVGQVQSDLLQNALQAKADILQQEVQMKLSRIVFEREQKLYQDKVSAKADLQNAENQVEKDVANLAALKAKLAATITVAQERLTLLGTEPGSAAKVLAEKKIDPYVTVRAPKSGLIIEKDINPGELADPSKNLFVLADLSDVWLVADVFEKDIEKINLGDEAEVTVDSLPQQPFPAKIIFIGASVDPQTRTMAVRANVNNPQIKLKPGMFARIKIEVGKLATLIIPKSCILTKGDKTFVYVAKGPSTFEERDIVSGDDDGSSIEIKKGLKDGEQVVSKGVFGLFGTAMQTPEGKNY